MSALTDARRLRHPSYVMTETGRYPQAADANYDIVEKHANMFSDAHYGIESVPEETEAEMETAR